MGGNGNHRHRIDRDLADEQWSALIKAELEADPPRPVVLSIWGTYGGLGHEAIADGYQSGDTDLVHINFGWDGILAYSPTARKPAAYHGRANTQVIIT